MDMPELPVVCVSGGYINAQFCLTGGHLMYEHSR